MEKPTRNKILIWTGIILTLGILAWIGYENWGWFREKGLVGWPPPDLDCDSTIEQGGFTYKLNKVFPSHSNDGTYTAMFLVTEIVPQHIQNSIQRGLSKSQYNKLVAKCPQLIPAAPTGNYQQDESRSYAVGGRVDESNKNPLQKYYGQKNSFAKEALSIKCVPPNVYSTSNLSQALCGTGDWIGGWIPAGYYASYHSSQPNSTNPTSCCYSIHKIPPPSKKG